MNYLPIRTFRKMKKILFLQNFITNLQEKFHEIWKISNKSWYLFEDLGICISFLTKEYSRHSFKSALI